MEEITDVVNPIEPAPLILSAALFNLIHIIMMFIAPICADATA